MMVASRYGHSREVRGNHPHSFAVVSSHRILHCKFSALIGRLHGTVCVPQTWPPTLFNHYNIPIYFAALILIDLMSFGWWHHVCRPNYLNFADVSFSFYFNVLSNDPMIHHTGLHWTPNMGKNRNFYSTTSDPPDHWKWPHRVRVINRGLYPQRWGNWEASGPRRQGRPFP